MRSVLTALDATVSDYPDAAPLIEGVPEAATGSLKIVVASDGRSTSMGTTEPPSSLARVCLRSRSAMTTVRAAGNGPYPPGWLPPSSTSAGTSWPQ